MTNAASSHSLPLGQCKEGLELFDKLLVDLADRGDKMTDGSHDSSDGDHTSDSVYINEEEDDVSDEYENDPDGDDDHAEERDYQNMVKRTSYLHISDSPMPTTYQEALSEPRGLKHEQELGRPSLKRPSSDTPSTAPGKRPRHARARWGERRDETRYFDSLGSDDSLTKLRQLVDQTREMMNNLHERAAEREELVAMIANRPEWDQSVIANISERLKKLEELPAEVEFDIADIQDRLTSLEASHRLLSTLAMDAITQVRGISTLVHAVFGTESTMQGGMRPSQSHH
ncbi:hypothetical protein BKA56DRAFT_677404 [Ilyonectria sp. MPI-CAGE-AT-0026]|nr:hypothetical protein BKA56DRAFT_677404 [Ilyonectria sp. MPI-CAGE-AT-0026]